MLFSRFIDALVGSAIATILFSGQKEEEISKQEPGYRSLRLSRLYHATPLCVYAIVSCFQILAGRGILNVHYQLFIVL